jgi:transposase
MPFYVGLDVSQKTTAICVVDQRGGRHWRGTCATDPSVIASLVFRHAGDDAKIGVETGSMTPWLVHGLRQAGLAVECLDARRVKAALQMRLNKTDQNDAGGLARWCGQAGTGPSTSSRWMPIGLALCLARGPSWWA